MKFHNIFTKSLLAGVLAISQNLFFISGLDQAKAQQSNWCADLGLEYRPGECPKGVAIFVNGNGDCCASGMTRVMDNLQNKGFSVRYTPWDKVNFYSRESKKIIIPIANRTFGSTSNDKDFVNGLHLIIDKIPSDIPVVLIGHSFGGDSLLSAVPRIQRRIQFFGVVDPVAGGALRRSIRERNVTDKVDYFYNRWQENQPWPIDFKSSGRVGTCKAKQQPCDQDSQNIVRNEDFSPRTRSCNLDEKITFQCPSSGKIQIRVSHQDLPIDAYLNKEIRLNS
jgi:hypothetical protein